MKVVLHIGPHKTGTTTIQRTLHVNAAALQARGYFYQPGPDEFNHHTNAAGLKAGADNREWAVSTLRGLIDQAATVSCHTCIISSEVFVENPDIALIREILSGHES